MSIVEDGPCQQILRTGGEGMGELFSRASKHWVLFRASSMDSQKHGYQLGQENKRVCKRLGAGVLERKVGRRRSSRKW
jgi:hypothetical protein